MADNSAIEWTDATWNPIRARNLKTGKVGWHCEHATTGCEFCYAEGFNKRLGTGLTFKPGHRRDIEIFLDEEMLTQPLRWKKPRMIFVCSMTDLFADFVPVEWIDRVFAVMALAPQHTFQVLTKRAQRMRDYMTLTRSKMGAETLGAYECIYNAMGDLGPGGLTDPYPFRKAYPNGMPWPLPNVWLGVSAERQEEADERIPLLLQAPAAIRFISAEPLLGPIDLNHIHEHGETLGGGYWDSWESCITGKRFDMWAGDDEDPMRSGHPKLDWVIAGGESGRNARPMHPDWARGLRDQCSSVGVPYFFKQWGEHVHAGQCTLRAEQPWTEVWIDENTVVARVGKKAAGRLLDGELHNAMPAVRA